MEVLPLDMYLMEKIKQIVGFLLNAIKLKCWSNTCEYSFNGLMHPHQNQLQPTHFTADYARIETACY